jgi:hypothetical protein
MVFEVLLTIRECRLDVVSHLELEGIGAKNERPAEIRFPLLKDRPEIEKEDVVFPDGEVGRIFGVRKEGILASANDSLVPVSPDSVQLLGKSVNFGVETVLGDAGADQPASLHLVK